MALLVAVAKLIPITTTNFALRINVERLPVMEFRVLLRHYGAIMHVESKSLVVHRLSQVRGH